MGVLMARADFNLKVVLSPHQQETICNGLIYGESLKSICAKLNIPLNHVFDYANKDPSFDKRMQQSRVYNSHVLADELIHCTDNAITIADSAVARVWSDNAKWVAAKMNPARYGERLEVNVTHLDLSSVLLAAENRVLPLLQAKAHVVSDTNTIGLAPIVVEGDVACRVESRPINDSREPIKSEAELGDSIPLELMDLI